MILSVGATGRDAGAWLREAGALIGAHVGHPRAGAMAQRIETLAKLNALFACEWRAGQVAMVPTIKARELMLEMRGWP